MCAHEVKCVQLALSRWLCNCSLISGDVHDKSKVISAEIDYLRMQNPPIIDYLRLRIQPCKSAERPSAKSAESRMQNPPKVECKSAENRLSPFARIRLVSNAKNRRLSTISENIRRLSIANPPWGIECIIRRLAPNPPWGPYCSSSAAACYNRG